MSKKLYMIIKILLVVTVSGASAQLLVIMALFAIGEVP